ncbi:hypothetical protein AAG612_09890 [Citromicrobium bathyomarinum]|uniref:hypothetical protein n=1 Tax=Citromicrobium bathyomarinum TaxID=72174 RepID=UPI00315A2CE5
MRLVDATNGPGGQIRAALGRLSWTAPLLFCIVAAVCATFLSGINFPEQNNRWQIPVVLDFAGSADGPHDTYTKSFANFISLFWIGVRSFTDERNIQTVFVAIQLAGNALLASAIFTFIRKAGQPVWPTAFVTGFLSFAYGLWGATALGYSEIFVTYATHTQYAIALSLFGLVRIMTGRPYLAGAMLGVAANINLFIAVWSACAAGLALIATQRRIATREQFGFSAAFLLIAAPVTVWGLAAGKDSGAIPVSFFHEFLAGHIYALDYPQALVQCFALLLSAALAIRSAVPGDPGQRLAVVMLACTAVLGVAATMPYIVEIPLLLLLHPLRFTSVPILLAAVGAGVLFIAAGTDRVEDDARSGLALFAAALALAGFVLKMPVVSVFGFALAVPTRHRRTRGVALSLSVACTLAVLLPAPPMEMTAKAALAFFLMCAILAAVALLRPKGAPFHLRLVAAALGLVAIAPLSSWVGVTGVCAVAAGALLLFFQPRWHAVGSIVAAAGAILALWTIRHDVVGVALIMSGSAIVLLVPAMRAISFARPLARAGLIALVPLMSAAGFANGVRHDFAPNPTEQQRDFREAQDWARVHTAIDAQFLPIGVEDGFSLFSRRTVWWEESQGAAVLWRPSFLPIWSSRKAALQAASTPEEIVALARREGVSFLIVPSTEVTKFESATPSYSNAHFAIIGLKSRP